MPWPITDLTEREQRIRDGVAGRLNFASVPGRKSRLGALAAEIAAEVDDNHQHIAYQAQQLHAASADEENLEPRHGRRWGLLRHQPQAAAGSVTFTGTNGVELPAGTALRHADGREYRTTDAAVIAGGSAVVGVQAVETGPEGNLAAAETLTLVESLAGVASTATAGDIEGGSALENLETYRARILFRQAHPPGGGHAADYIVWTMAVPGGITHVWVLERSQGHGTVTVRFAAYDAPDGPIPSEAMRQAVEDYIEGHLSPVTGQWEGRPSGMEVFVVAIVGNPLDLEFSELLPDTPAVRTAIRDSLAEMLRRRAVPGGTIRLDWINEAISKAVGEDRHRLTSPAADFTCTANQLATVGDITVTG